MTDFHYEDEQDSSSRHLLVPVEDLLRRSENRLNELTKKKNSFRSRSVDRSLIDKNEIIDFSLQRSFSLPNLSKKNVQNHFLSTFNDDQREKTNDFFIYNVDLSQSNKIQENFLEKIFFDPTEISIEDSTSFQTSCLTIEEETEDELRQTMNSPDHVQHAKIFRNSSPNSSDFLVTNNSISDETKKIDEKIISSGICSSSSSLSSNDEQNFIRTSEFRFQEKAFSNFQSSNFENSDSGILVDKNEINEQFSSRPIEIYRQNLIDMKFVKMKLSRIDDLLKETIKDLEIERTLIDDEHEFFFRRILNETQIDQEKIEQFHEHFTFLVRRITMEKNSIRQQINLTQKILFQLEIEINLLEHETNSDDEQISKKRKSLVEIQKKYEDLEFQLMELETRCEAELEKVEEDFQSEEKFFNENAKQRKAILRDLNRQQKFVLSEIENQKEKFEREKEKLKILLRTKKIQLNSFEEKFISPIDFVPPLEIKMRDRSRTQERPLTRYLPIRSSRFDLRSHIEAGGHRLECPEIFIDENSCRGFIQKMSGIKLKFWKRRWFVFDRQRRFLFYFRDKNEAKLRGSIDFRSIVDVYVDHFHSNSVRQTIFVLKTESRNFFLSAPTVEAMRIWVDVLVTGAEANSFAVRR